MPGYNGRSSGTVLGMGGVNFLRMATLVRQRQNGRVRRSDNVPWHRYLPTRNLHPSSRPPKRCCFCDALTGFPSRDGWWWKRLESPNREGPLTLSCCRSCHRSGRRAPTALLEIEVTPEPVMQHGLPARPRHCVKCGGLLYQEPGFARCRWGCGKLWPVRGTSLAEQMEYERRSGLLLIA